MKAQLVAAALLAAAAMPAWAQSHQGGVNVARMRQQLENVPRGGSVWAFALPE